MTSDITPFYLVLPHKNHLSRNIWEKVEVLHTQNQKRNRQTGKRQSTVILRHVFIIKPN